MATVVKKNLVIKRLRAGVDGKEILHQLDLVIKPGKVVALMGPNGSGKSTLAQVLMGNGDYQVLGGQVLWQGKNILKLKPDERAKLGLFMSFQYPYELSGINMYEFLSTSFAAIHGEKKHRVEFENRLYQSLKILQLSETYLNRSVNEGFSGGEKKKSEILQLLLLNPKIAILDETDSGLDIDALKLIAKSINGLRSATKGFLVITHYQRLLNYLKPDEVWVMLGGKIVKQGPVNLVKVLEKKGYDWLKS
ncbi:MAG: Fe-S cluster assembly ATPase SufC [Candidatus Buchananbacteria bacterium]|nr:Fe-S cluster assembly ATPase SufC [Candidatus Buchananbacteria bacterium]